MSTKAELQAVIDIIGEDSEILAVAKAFTVLAPFRPHPYLTDSSRRARRLSAERVLQMLAVRLGVVL